MSNIKKSFGLIILSIFILLAIARLLADQSWSDRNIAISQEIGNNIAISLENYFEDNARYPDSLSSLVPKYLPAIIQPVAGDGRWVYFVFKGDDKYLLAFGKSVSSDDPLYMYPACQYNAQEKRWRITEW